jgi:hypothetical protein
MKNTKGGVQMIYEFRIYKLHPGKLSAFKKRFSEISVRLFKKFGIRFCGFWEIAKLPEGVVPKTSKGGIVREAKGAQFGQDEIAYLVAFDSIEQRDKAWLEWIDDKEWQKLKAETEAEGPLVLGESYFLLKPAEFSPIK